MYAGKGLWAFAMVTLSFIINIKTFYILANRFQNQGLIIGFINIPNYK